MSTLDAALSKLSRSVRALAISVGAAVLALGVSLIVIWLSGGPPGEAIQALWDGALGNETQLAGTLSKMIPLLLVALGWSLAFRAKRVNIGFEGQILVGGTLATVVGMHLHGLPTAVHLPLAVLASAVGGALWAGIAAFMWARRGVNEIISTLLLNFVAIQLVSWLVRGPLQEPTGTFPRSGPLDKRALWPRLLENTSLSWDIVLAVVLVGVVAFVLARTTFGYRLRLVGANEEAARWGGVATATVAVVALVLSGALGGLAGGSIILAGETGSMADNFSAGFGFAGIAVALLARNNPIACIPAAFLFAVLRQGGGLMESRVGVSFAIVQITQGLVILLVAGVAVLADRRRVVRLDPSGRTSSEPSLAEAAR